MPEDKFVANDLFKGIELDNRVNRYLSECLYCYVNTEHGDTVLGTDYKIALREIQTGFKQCPACKRIYIVGDFFPNLPEHE